MQLLSCKWLTTPITTQTEELQGSMEWMMATAARATVTAATARLLSGADDEGDGDPFAELEEDDDELDESETVLEDC